MHGPDGPGSVAGETVSVMTQGAEAIGTGQGEGTPLGRGKDSGEPARSADPRRLLWRIQELQRLRGKRPPAGVAAQAPVSRSHTPGRTPPPHAPRPHD